MDYFFKFWILLLGFLCCFPLSQSRHQSSQNQFQATSFNGGSAVEERARMLSNRANNNNFSRRQPTGGGGASAMGMVAGNGKAFGSVSNRRGSVGVNVRRSGQNAVVDLLGNGPERFPSDGNLRTGNRPNTSGRRSSIGPASNSVVGQSQSAKGLHGRDVIIIPAGRNSARGRNPVSSGLNGRGSLSSVHSGGASGNNMASNVRNLIEVRNRLNRIISQRTSQLRGLQTRNKDGMLVVPLQLVRTLLRRNQMQRPGFSARRPSNGLLNGGMQGPLSPLSALLNSRNFEIERKEPKFLQKSLKGTLLPGDLNEESLLFLAPLLSQLTKRLGQNSGSPNMGFPTTAAPFDILNAASDLGKHINNAGKMLSGPAGGNNPLFGLLALGMMDFPEAEVLEEILRDVPEKGKRQKNVQRKPSPRKKPAATNTNTKPATKKDVTTPSSSGR